MVLRDTEPENRRDAERTVGGVTLHYVHAYNRAPARGVPPAAPHFTALDKRRRHAAPGATCQFINLINLMVML
eukprot:gene11203-biopygen2647